MPILEKSSNNAVLSNGDSRIGPEEDDILSSAVNSRHNVLPTRQPNEVNDLRRSELIKIVTVPTIW